MAGVWTSGIRVRKVRSEWTVWHQSKQVGWVDGGERPPAVQLGRNEVSTE